MMTITEVSAVFKLCFFLKLLEWIYSFYFMCFACMHVCMRTSGMLGAWRCQKRTPALEPGTSLWALGTPPPFSSAFSRRKLVPSSAFSAMRLANAGSPRPSLSRHRASLSLFSKLVNRTSGLRFAPRSHTGRGDRGQEGGAAARLQGGGERLARGTAGWTPPLIGRGGRRRGARGLFSSPVLSFFPALSLSRRPGHRGDRAPQTPWGRS